MDYILIAISPFPNKKHSKWQTISLVPEISNKKLQTYIWEGSTELATPILLQPVLMMALKAINGVIYWMLTVCIGDTLHWELEAVILHSEPHNHLETELCCMQLGSKPVRSVFHLCLHIHYVCPRALFPPFILFYFLSMVFHVQTGWDQWHIQKNP